MSPHSKDFSLQIRLLFPTQVRGFYCRLQGWKRDGQPGRGGSRSPAARRSRARSSRRLPGATAQRVTARTVRRAPVYFNTGLHPEDASCTKHFPIAEVCNASPAKDIFPDCG
ncbi:hypothetical protein DV515_00004890 [Chloebia gouldiae]|uniref:Uncharacterized protein n=1 Tax=Chloebia gouldiae TaxID=44316 RepID=A0A3L8SPK2_CHLGU|nr:hypothetical protein DV515_00004890 [Chloebia gouldiae]